VRYEKGDRLYCGHRLPDGKRKHQPLAAPLLTPTTKAPAGQHDELTAKDAIVASGALSAELYERAESLVLALFRAGTEWAASRGLILVDTKYELGIDDDGRLRLIDEVHTPDSSRYWLASTYAARRDAGAEPDSADKELVRRWYAERGYRGDGEPPALPADVAGELSARYVDVYERLTGTAFVPAPDPAEPRIAAALRAWLDRSR
jgi:phosphoribosylaminoimidazole-succinocarboxamide synthase